MSPAAALARIRSGARWPLPATGSVQDSEANSAQLVQSCAARFATHTCIDDPARAVAAIRAQIEEAIADRRPNLTGTTDVLSTLLGASQDGSVPMEHENLVDQLMGLWFGGSDTTASALGWTVAMLAQHPDALEALCAEADGYTGNFDSFADLNELPYARAAFDEAPRIQGALLLTRQALEDDEIAGVRHEPDRHPRGSLPRVQGMRRNRSRGRRIRADGIARASDVVLDDDVATLLEATCPSMAITIVNI